MEQTVLPPQSPQKRSNLIFIPVALVVALAAGVSVYFWQQTNLSKLQNEIYSQQQQIQKLQEQIKALSDTKTTSTPATLDNRILLTTENIGQYNGKTSDERCNEPFNFEDPATTTVNYSNKQYGVSFSVPFNPSWGSNKYRIEPYYEWEDRVTFGPISIGEGCGWMRTYTLTVLPKRTAEQAITTLKVEYGKYHQEGSLFDDQFTLWPTEEKINDIPVVKYIPFDGLGIGIAYMEIIGRKNNYQLFAWGSSEKAFEVFESIVNSIGFID